jgi:hypothetical protein
MFRKRFLRVASLLLSALPAQFAVIQLATPTAVVAQEAASCFTGVDYSALSFTELTALVEQSVAAMPSGMPNDEIVVRLGSEIGASANGCSPAELRAIAQNVALILDDMGIDTNGQAAAILIASLPPGAANGPVSIDDLSPSFATASVY